MAGQSDLSTCIQASCIQLTVFFPLGVFKKKKFKNVKSLNSAHDVQFLIFVVFPQRTPLQLAVERNHIDTVKCLVAQGADISVKDDRGVSI